MNEIVFEGVYNFRDLGGHATTDGGTVRRGLVFRSDSLHHLTTEDVRLARDELGVRTLIDLRTAPEIEVVDHGPLAVPPVVCHHVSLIDPARMTNPPDGPVDRSPAATAERYFGNLTAANTEIARAITLIADGLPAIFFCAAGKDRTGVLAAVLLGLLGVSDEDIVRDYAATADSMAAIIERLREFPLYAFGLEGTTLDELRPRPETMEQLLAAVHREYGSMEEYALASGVEQATIDRLRSELVEP